MRRNIRKTLKSIICFLLTVMLIMGTYINSYAWQTENKVVGVVSDSPLTINLGSIGYQTSAKKWTTLVSNESLNTVKTSMFGANDSWVDDGYGLWDAENDEPYEPVLEKLRASGVYHLRYPGGTEGDYMHWYDTIGEVSERTPQMHVFSKEYPTYTASNGELYVVTFGVDEVFELCEAADIKATIQLNAGTGSPQEAADWIYYIEENDWLDMIDSFAVGNEVCLNLENLADMGIYVQKSPLQYINFCNELFEILGDEYVDGDIPLGIIGMTPSHPLSANKNWDKQVIDALKDKIDFIDVHIGYSYYYNDNGETADECVQCFLASATWIKSMIEEEKAIIEEWGGQYADDISIQITEWGPVGGSYPASLASAIFVADTLDVMLSEPKVSAADYLPLLNHYAAGNLIGANTNTAVTGGDEYYWDNAVSYVYKWYSDLVGRDVLKTTVTGGDTFDSTAVGMVPAVEDVDNGNVTVYFDDETGEGSIFIINRSLEENQKYDIAFPVENAKVTGVTELWNEDPTEANTWKEQTNIIPISYDNYKGSAFDTLSVTTKPVSLVKIDFTTEDIDVYVNPNVVYVDAKEESASNSGNTGNNPPSKEAEEESVVEEIIEAVQNVIRKIIKKVKVFTEDNSLLVTIIIILISLVGVFSIILLAAALYFKRKKQQQGDN